MAAESQPAGSISWPHLGWYRQESLDHLLSTRSYERFHRDAERCGVLRSC